MVVFPVMVWAQAHQVSERIDLAYESFVRKVTDRSNVTDLNVSCVAAYSARRMRFASMEDLARVNLNRAAPIVPTALVEQVAFGCAGQSLAGECPRAILRTALAVATGKRGFATQAVPYRWFGSVGLPLVVVTCGTGAVAEATLPGDGGSLAIARWDNRSAVAASRGVG